MAQLFSRLLHIGMDATRYKKGAPELALVEDEIAAPSVPVYMDSIENRLLVLDRVDNRLTETLEHLPNGRAPDGSILLTSWLDDYLQGIDAFNRTLSSGAQPIQVLLCLVNHPQRDILEIPREPILGYYGRSRYNFASLWDKHCRSHIELTRFIVRRYMTYTIDWEGRPRRPLVTAIELINEPDYHFIPDEVRIEEAIRPEARPLEKYVTELHLQQIPRQANSSAAAEKTDWGFVEQKGEWTEDSHETVGVLAYNWGSKFNWYVKAAAELIRHMSFAAKCESTSSGVDFTIVSGGVTHNNLDYLFRMYSQNNEVFRWCDAVAVHPYHWPQHNIWDSHFVNDAPKHEWKTSSPHDFANNFLKRFDFIEEVAAMTRMQGEQESYGLAGKKIWVTEFGLGTKKLGAANRPLANFIKFIKQRGEPELEFPSIDWEDIWDAFLRQVDRDYLDRNNVGAFIFYALRETDRPHLDRNDEDRTNFAILKKDGRPRMSVDTSARFRRLVESLN